MFRAATARRALAALAIVAVVTQPVGAFAIDGGSSTAKGTDSLQMPGAKMRMRNPISVQSVSALHFIQRTENINDPQYLAARKNVSDAVAAKLNIDAVALDKAWSRAPRAHQIAVLAAITQLDVPYLEGKEYPYVFMDCSGLMWYAWRTAGVDLPRQSVSQMDRLMRVERKDAIVGNIVGEGTHIHMYLGIGNAMIHAPFDRKTVRLKMMSEEQASRVIWTNPSLIATYRL
jgi:cell wall-associated NlpC family hydrolase